MDPISVLLTVAAAVSASFGIVLLYHGDRGRVSFVYSVNILMILWWVWSMFFYRLANPDSIIFWTKMLYTSASAIATSFFYFSYIFPKPERFVFVRKFFPIFLSNLSLILFVWFGDLIIFDAQVISGAENTIDFGVLYGGYVVFILFFFLGGFWRIIQKYRITEERSERIQIIYLLFGYMTGANISFATNLLAPWFGYFAYNWVGQLTSVLMIVSTTYAIVRHHLFDVKIIATELLVFLLWVSALARVLISETFREQVINGGFFVLTIFIGVLLIRSVLREVRTREEIEKLAQDLERANKRLTELDQLKSEFLSIASHQMRSPLTAIKGYASLILDGTYGKVSDSVREAVRKMFLSTESMIGVVESFLNVSRIEQGRMQYAFAKSDLEDLVAEVVAELKPVIDEKGLSISFESSKKEYLVHMDKDKMKQVFVNLIDNAVKYTKQGGITVKMNEQGDIIRTTISDTGVGMSEADIKRLFQRFSRAEGASKINTKGTGLGLYVAKEMVTAHKGKVWAESDGKGKGSRFIVEVPSA